MYPPIHVLRMYQIESKYRVDLPQCTKFPEHVLVVRVNDSIYPKSQISTRRLVEAIVYDSMYTGYQIPDPSEITLLSAHSVIIYTKYIYTS